MMALYVLVGWTVVSMSTVGMLNVAKLLVRLSAPAGPAGSDSSGSGGFWPPPIIPGAARAA